MPRTLRTAVAAVLLATVHLSAPASAAGAATYTYGVSDRLDVGDYPGGVAVDSTEHKAFVAAKGEYVEVVDTVTRRPVDLIRVDADTELIAIDPVLHRAYVSGTDASGSTQGHEVLTVIDTRSDEVVDTLLVNSYATALAVDPVSHYVYIGFGQYSTVEVVDPMVAHGTLTTIALGGGPNAYSGGMAVDPKAHRLYVADTTTPSRPGGHLTVVDTRSERVVGTIASGSSGAAIALDRQAHRLYVPDLSSHSLQVLDTTTGRVVGTIPLDDDALPVTVDLDVNAHTAYVNGTEQGALYVIDLPTGTVLQKIATDSSYYRTGVDTRTHRAFLSERNDATMLVVSRRRTSR